MQKIATGLGLCHYSGLVQILSLTKTGTTRKETAIFEYQKGMRLALTAMV
ncbi:hypothetical Protein YC6258_04141 [Gynuella sunshinyii YC6258]|uniref:Uncharacterized protein n=1 Tax=Gynuella sunshinyii YC6258 TaxID=1445510 RepID=A0A0C5VN92_9GAMM|nr:hypothetical Protein YC6258_04141 [Gynuella sunshinyii YC6258]